MEWIGFAFDLDLIWIEIGVFKNVKECARSPCNGNHFSSIATVQQNLLELTKTLHNGVSFGHEISRLKEHAMHSVIIPNFRL